MGGIFGDIGGFLTDTVGSIFDSGSSSGGSWLSDLLGSGGSSASSAASSSDDSWSWKSIFSPKNVISGIGAFATASAKSDKLDSEQALLDRKFQQELELERMREASALQLAQLKGGGSGANIAYQRERDRYQGMLGAANERVNARVASGNAVLDAIRNLTQASQAPLR